MSNRIDGLDQSADYPAGSIVGPSTLPAGPDPVHRVQPVRGSGMVPTIVYDVPTARGMASEVVWAAPSVPARGTPAAAPVARTR